VGAKVAESAWPAVEVAGGTLWGPRGAALWTPCGSPGPAHSRGGPTPRRATSTTCRPFTDNITSMPTPRGQHQRRALAQVADPEQIVEIKVRIPARLRSKAHTHAAALNISAAAYLERLLEAAPTPEPIQPSLPLAQSA